MPAARPRFAAAEYEARLARVRTAMAMLGLDTLIVTDPSNMAWLTGYDGWSFYVHQAVALGPDGPPVWLGRGQDAAGARLTCWMADDRIEGYPDHYVQSTERHPMTWIADRLAARGWHRGRIGVEMDTYYYSAKAHTVLDAALPAALVDATALVNWARMEKSVAEIALMRRAARIVERIHARIRDEARPGVRKSDLVARIYDAALAYDPDWGHGGDYPAIVPLLPSGADAAAPHLTWDDRPLARGEGTFFEVAGCVARYHCPLSRSVFLGAPPDMVRRAEAAVLEGMEAGLAAARPGATCEDVARAFFDVLAREGIEKDSRTGYPVGLSYPPDWGERTCSLRPGDRTVLTPGMTFHFMTGLWMEAWGLEITETFLVAETGAECLARVPRELAVVL